VSKIESRVYRINPGYLVQYEEFIRSHAQFGGGSEDEKYRQARTFSSVYELYMYAFFIGLKRAARKAIYPEDRLKTFWEMENWKPRDLVDCLLACAISESNVDMNRLEVLGEAEMGEELSKVRRTIEEYANGGIVYLLGLFEKEPDLVEDEMLFIRLLSEQD